MKSGNHDGSVTVKFSVNGIGRQVRITANRMENTGAECIDAPVWRCRIWIDGIMHRGLTIYHKETVFKVLYGLLEDVVWCWEERSLEVIRGQAHYSLKRP